MTWYYVKDGEAAGPISDEELLSKLRLGAILPTSLVWRTGMIEWQPASSVAPQIIPVPAPEPSLSPGLGTVIDAPPELTAGTPPVLPNFFCTMCGTIIPADQLVRISGRAVCAACKPLYVQQTREGLDAPVKAPVLGSLRAAPPNGDVDLADPFVRFVAHILDNLFLTVPIIVGFVLFSVLMGMTAAANNSSEPPVAVMIGMFAAMGLGLGWVFFYWTWFIGRSGATPGMRIMKIRMVRADRGPVSYGRAFGRFVVFYIINQCTMGLSNLTVFFDREKRTVTDMMFDTRVVRN